MTENKQHEEIVGSLSNSASRSDKASDLVPLAETRTRPASDASSPSAAGNAPNHEPNPRKPRRKPNANQRRLGRKTASAATPAKKEKQKAVRPTPATVRARAVKRQLNRPAKPGYVRSARRTLLRPTRPRTYTSRTASLLALLTHHQVRESLLLSSIPSPRNAIVAGAQAAMAVLLALLAAYWSPWPHLTGFAALGALASLFGRYASMSRRRFIVAVSGALLTLAVLIVSIANVLLDSTNGVLIVIAAIAGGAVIAASYWRLGGPGAVIFLFTAGAALAPTSEWLEVAQRALATGAGAVIAWLLCSVTDRLRAQPTQAAATPPEHSRPFRNQMIAGGRSAAAVLVAALIAEAAGWRHPEWAAIGTLAVMQGRHLHVTMNRALQRMAGTVVGSLVVWFILVQHPPFWLMVVFIVVFQFTTEIIIGYNYALGQITVTPMALLMTALTAPVVDPSLPVARVLDTILGAAIGIVFAVIFSSVDDRVYLARRRRALDASRRS